MKLKAREIYEMAGAINTLSQEKTTMPTAFYIAKNTKLIKEEANSIEEARNNLVVQFGEKKSDGALNTNEDGMVKIDDLNLAAFNEQLSKLFDAEIDIDIKKIPLSALDKINIPISTIELLLPIIEDDTVCECESCDCQAENKTEAQPVDLVLDGNGNIIQTN